MEFYHFILIAVVLVLAYFIIKNKKKLKDKNNDPPDIIYKVVSFLYTPLTREALIFLYINLERAKVKVIKMVSDKFIMQLANERVDEVDKDNKISHGGAPKSFIKMRKRGTDGESEIIAYGFLTAKGSIKNWLKSPSHKKAMLNPKYTICSVSCKRDEHGRWIDLVLMASEKTML